MSYLEYKKIKKQLTEDAKYLLKNAVISENKAKLDALLPIVTKILGKPTVNEIIKKTTSAMGK